MPEQTALKEKIKKAIDIKTVAIIGLIISQTWSYVSDVFTKGMQQEFQDKVEQLYEKDSFRDKVDEAFQENMRDPMVLSMVLSSSQVTDFAEENAKKVKAAIVDQVLREDSTKVSTVSYLGRQTGLRDEDILPLLAEIIKAWEEKELITKDQAESMFKRTVRANF